MTPFETLKEFVKKVVPSWTLWLAVVWGILSVSPEVLSSVVEAFGEPGSVTTTRVVAATLFITRLRSIFMPVIASMWDNRK